MNKTIAVILETFILTVYFLPSFAMPSDHHANRVIVRYRSQAASNRLTSQIGHVTERFQRTGIDLVALASGENVNHALTRLRRDPGVLYAEPDYLIRVEDTPNDPYYTDLWGLPIIHTDEAWQYTTGSPSVIVAVIDTGVDYTHSDLAGNIWTNSEEIPNNGIDDDNNGYIDDVHGYDFCNYDGNPFDDNGHGTHCAGIIGAIGFNNIGIIGVCPNVTIMPVKFLSMNGSGYTSDAIRAIEYAVQVKTLSDTCLCHSLSHSLFCQLIQHFFIGKMFRILECLHRCLAETILSAMRPLLVIMP